MGKIVVLTSDNEPAKTVLAFMVKSLRSEFAEIVSLIPVYSLTAVKLRNHFDDVMFLLKDL